MQKVLTTIQVTPNLTIDDGNYIPSYGTGSYLTLDAPNSTTTHCKSADGGTKFVIVDITPNAMVVNVIEGDVNNIKRLVETEINHFDSEVVWAN